MVETESWLSSSPTFHHSRHITRPMINDLQTRWSTTSNAQWMNWNVKTLSSSRHPWIRIVLHTKNSVGLVDNCCCHAQHSMHIYVIQMNAAELQTHWMANYYSLNTRMPTPVSISFDLSCLQLLLWCRPPNTCRLQFSTPTILSKPSFRLMLLNRQKPVLFIAVAGHAFGSLSFSGDLLNWILLFILPWQNKKNKIKKINIIWKCSIIL